MNDANARSVGGKSAHPVKYSEIERQIAALSKQKKDIMVEFTIASFIEQTEKLKDKISSSLYNTLEVNKSEAEDGRISLAFEEGGKLWTLGESHGDICLSYGNRKCVVFMFLRFSNSWEYKVKDLVH